MPAGKSLEGAGLRAETRFRRPDSIGYIRQDVWRNRSGTASGKDNGTVHPALCMVFAGIDSEPAGACRRPAQQPRKRSVFPDLQSDTAVPGTFGANGDGAGMAK